MAPANPDNPPPSYPLDAIIIGAGLSGLTTAYTLTQKGYNICLLEAGDAPGGLIRSIREEGFLTEAGPNTFPSSATALIRLCRSLDLSPVPASPLASNRYLYLNDALIRLPNTPIDFLSSPILPWRAKLRLLGEPFISRGKGEETVADFVRRRLGQTVLENLVTPFLSGIYAGDPEQLSLPATFPKLSAWEHDAGSLLKGAFQAMGEARKKRKDEGIPRTPYALMSFDGGMQALPHALAQALPMGSLRTRTPVRAVTRDSAGFHVHLQTGEVLMSHAVVLATPAMTAAHLLEALSPRASAILSGIPYAPIAVVHLGVERQSVPHPLDGFGFLIPRTQHIPLLGSIWASRLFPDRAPEGMALFSCFIGGALFPEAAQWHADRLIEQVLKDLCRVFKQPALTAGFQKVHQYDNAIPQYTLGHRDRVSKLSNSLTEVPGLAVTGNYLTGVSLNDCVRHGEETAQAVERYLSEAGLASSSDSSSATSSSKS